ncbi:hypothetical protein ACG2LH_13175 [Zhouia sp. PK063]|uniref:hypothetical protein n=1 Tax=Zhouia sp. PK063 TaxID=3373602 RepID=UPI00379AC1B6
MFFRRICREFFLFLITLSVHSQTSPNHIKFVRQAAQRLIFDEQQQIPLANFNPKNSVGFSSMYPVNYLTANHSNYELVHGQLQISATQKSTSTMWFAGFNPFATYTLNITDTNGEGVVGFKYADEHNKEQFLVKVYYHDHLLTDVKLQIIKQDSSVTEQSIAVHTNEKNRINGQLILQFLGSGFTIFKRDDGLPKVIAQSNFNTMMDLRNTYYLHHFQSQLYSEINSGSLTISSIQMGISTGIGLADIRAITYENGAPMLDNGRLWYTMSIRGRALPHHIQGVFSLNPTTFDLKLEGIIVFDRNDELLRNEIASHIFYDRKRHIWRGITTGFSAYANPKHEKKQLLAVESLRDPRFGFSIMKATPFGMVGDIEDPHILYDEQAKKWRILACQNHDGYKAMIFQSDLWNKNYTKIAGPVAHNSTGTSIQKIGKQLYCFSGSADRKIYVYSYPDLHEEGVIHMDLPPWDATSGTRVWPNIVQLPEDYPFKYVALMMDRYNFPGQEGPQWSYGALYLYHGFEE